MERFQASLRDAAPSPRTLPGVRNAGLFSDGPRSTPRFARALRAGSPGPASRARGQERIGLKGASVAKQEVPEGPLKIARQFTGGKAPTLKPSRVPEGRLNQARDVWQHRSPHESRVSWTTRRFIQENLPNAGVSEEITENLRGSKERRRSTLVTCLGLARRDRMTAMATAKRKKVSATPTSISGKSAMDELLDSFGEIIDSGAEKMNSSELKKSEERFNEIVDRVVASRKRRRETA